MKRTKNIRHNTFRKAIRPYAITPIALAISATLFITGCQDKTDETVTLYQNAEQCIQNNPSMSNECTTSYQKALEEAEKTAPKYATRQDCIEEFSENLCVENSSNQVNNTSNPQMRESHSFWMPLMAGYMFGRMSGGGFASAPLFSGTSTKGNFVDASGRNIAGASSMGRSVKIDKSALAPKPATTSTITRGGFGRSVANAAATNTHSNRSSSTSASRSFGG